MSDYVTYIQTEALQQLIAICRSGMPDEVCGLVAYRTDDPKRVVSAIMPLQNAHPSPRHHFELDPAEWVSAYFQLLRDGYSVAGIYHSHPNGPAFPSETDLAQRLWEPAPPKNKPSGSAEGLQMWIISLADLEAPLVAVFAPSAQGAKRSVLAEVGI
ncbi:M67 family metallopeptidase [Paenibacillus pasadenensis]|uniref:Mov34/MPN/PAD-1 family protein n=1 Tax=Paenibacillus pasadenensis TaxID=217090 RepID=UPI00204009D6|nr:M67 family metallopeptidase [Paenibacillus pasadenensis]MCM3747150.1 M67 family metallopeptidase [Paenibacillus pasadenensis]